MLLSSRQGKVRLQKFYTTELGDSPKQHNKSTKEIINSVLTRKPKMCNFIDWQDKKIVYKRYASLFFIVVIDKTDNELLQLEQIHRFVEILDQYFGNVCELDIIFNFEKTYFLLDEYLLAGELQETSKNSILKAVEDADEQQAACDDQDMARNFLEEFGLAWSKNIFSCFYQIIEAKKNIRIPLKYAYI